MQYPDWLPVEEFEGFLAQRIEAKQVKFNTERSIKIMLRKLERWHEFGYDITVIIAHCTEKQYRGLYLPPNIEPRQTHLKASQGPLFDQVQTLKEKTKVPESNPEKGRKALNALQSVLNDK